MKIKMRVLLLAFFTILFLTSCQEEDDNNNDDFTTERLDSVLNSGEWEVTTFYDDELDFLSDIEMYTFNFAETGVLDATAIDNPDNSGTWRTFEDNGLHVELNFESFFDNLLNGYWKIIELDDNKIELFNDNNTFNNASTLIFEKKT